MRNVEVIKLEEEELENFKKTDIFKKIDKSMFSEVDCIFMNTLIKEYKPKKILEIGAGFGFSSSVILNAIKDDPDAKLYSTDYNSTLPANNGDVMLIGYHVDSFPELKAKWKLYAGCGFVSNVIGEIGSGIDFVFLDTMHRNPGEILDLLMVLPFLNNGAIIVIHDIALDKIYFKTGKAKEAKITQTCAILYSALNGKTLIIDGCDSFDIQRDVNIGAKKLEYHPMDIAHSLFYLLTLKWSQQEIVMYLENEKNIIDYFTTYYSYYYSNYLTNIFDYQKQILKY